MATQPQVTAGGSRQLMLVAALGGLLLLLVGLLVLRPLLSGTGEGQATPPPVTVDGTPYSVTEGESFAGSYRAVDINSECATFESGTTSFTLCQGEAVLK
jgi:hypothetical protein